MRVLLTDGNERAALAAARSLVADGCEVFVVASKRLALAGAARGVRQCLLPVDPLADPAGFTRGIASLARRHGVRVLLPVTDGSTEALLRHRELLPPEVALPLPDLAGWRAATDKAESLGAARAAGLAVPESIVLRTPADAAHLPGPAFFPAVVKPHRSVVTNHGQGGAAVKLAVSPVPNVAACAAVLAALPAAAYPVLLQRRVEGSGEGLFMLRWDGRIVASFAHRRLREKPPWGGVSVYRESIAPERALVSAGTRLLEALNWRGVAMIECKRDAASGRHVFMEINGRLWGSLQLAIDAGVDFPRLLVRHALGMPLEPAHGYRVGVRSRWFWGDVDHLYLRLRRGPARLDAVRGFFAHHADRDREEIWRWRDPGPFIAETLQRMGLAM